MQKIFNKTLYISLLLAILGQSPAVFAAKAPVFSLPGIKKDVNLKSYRNKRIVYVDFWASWCGPCRKSFPWMNEMHEKYGKKGLKIIAISLDESRKDAVGFLKKNPAKFTIAFDPSGKTGEQYKVEAMPSSYLIDRKGNLVSSHMGFNAPDKEKLEAKFKKMLGIR